MAVIVLIGLGAFFVLNYNYEVITSDDKAITTIEVDKVAFESMNSSIGTDINKEQERTLLPELTAVEKWIQVETVTSEDVRFIDEIR